MFLLSLCIHIEINSTARIQYLKKKRKEQNYVCTKDVSEIREKKNEKSNNMAYPKKEERISKLVFPFRFKSKDK
jgi:hypothetical protein